MPRPLPSPASPKFRSRIATLAGIANILAAPRAPHKLPTGSPEQGRRSERAGEPLRASLAAPAVAAYGEVEGAQPVPDQRVRPALQHNRPRLVLRAPEAGTFSTTAAGHSRRPPAKRAPHKRARAMQLHASKQRGSRRRPFLFCECWGWEDCLLHDLANDGPEDALVRLVVDAVPQREVDLAPPPTPPESPPPPPPDITAAGTVVAATVTPPPPSNPTGADRRQSQQHMFPSPPQKPCRHHPGLVADLLAAGTARPCCRSPRTEWCLPALAPMSLVSPVPGKYSPYLWKDTVITCPRPAPPAAPLSRQPPVALGRVSGTAGDRSRHGIAVP